MGGASDNVDPDIIVELLSMLDKNNELVKTFRMAQNRFENEDLDEFKLVLILSQSSSGRPNHITPFDEVAAFIVCDDTDTGGFRDTVVNSKQEGLKRIYETDPHFMQLQYPLLFPWGTEGYHKRIPLISNKYSETENLDDEELDPDSTQRRHISLREYYCYKIMIHTSEGLTPYLVGRLWQQYIVDQFAAIEQYRLYRDSLAIYRAIVHPSLFLTMTCNSKWPEIHEMLKLLPNVDPVDAPDIVSRVFKLKLDQLLDLIKKKNYFGKCIGEAWFATRAYAKNSNPIAYEAVKNYMMYGPYLMVIPILTIVVFLFIRGVTLCHINLEICNSSRSLKYLFKYCLKGHDTATMLLKKKSNKSGNEQTARSVKNLDEVNNFLDGRYVCASEASWRIFGFDIHHRSPSVERLPINLPGQKYLNFQSSADLENVCNNATSKKSKLEACCELLMVLHMIHLRKHVVLLEKHWPTVSDDVLYMRHKISDDIHLTLSEYEIHNYALTEGKIVLSVAVSEIAATLLPGGRTAHSRFKIPLKLDQSSIAGIKHGTYIAELIQHTSLIIWDEAPMQHRYAFEAVNRSLRDIMAVVDVERGKRPFGGITVVFGGGF
ncbi:uncharacterized protein LOC141699785 [Apium graveolens]|uniref:uncharacterized protein LOC141699785 n=1 Tax=Apium graveolens TaxID=4045 RepID=UPI003D7A3909